MSILRTTTRLTPGIASRCVYLQRHTQQVWFSQGSKLGFHGSIARWDRWSDEFEEKSWEFDDISSLGHAELEQVREARQYARIAAYEMPRLYRFVKPFEPPTSRHCLRFRYTTYFGEKHPSEAKVVMEFSPHDPNFRLSEIQQKKFIKLVGPRYNPETGIIQISCEMFEKQAQNKRYLSDNLNRLLKEARDATDTFEDIPIDLRHYKRKWKNKKPRFPEEWKVRLPKKGALEAQHIELAEVLRTELPS